MDTVSSDNTSPDNVTDINGQQVVNQATFLIIPVKQHRLTLIGTETYTGACTG